MNPDNSSKNLSVLRFKIDATHCPLRIGEQVLPGTELGRDYETGDIVSAECRGKVVAMEFKGGEHAFVVLIEPEG